MTASAPTTDRQRSLVWPLLLGLAVAALGVGVIRDFSGPLLDGGDTDQYAYTSYYFANNLSLWPLPRLDLYNSQAFYPYGTHHVFLPWGFERDYLYALLNRWPDAEYRPFLQVYYLYSLVVGAVGTYLLLWRRFGAGRAAVAGLIVSVFSFYNLFKYPIHLNMAVVHWTVLCILATFRVLHDLYHGHRVSLAFWLLWAGLHLTVLGLELGYVAGFALAFTTLSLPCIGYQLWKRSRSLVGSQFFRLKHWLTDEYAANRWSIIGLMTLLLLMAWAYLPLAAQISTDALGYTFPPMDELRAWSHPARLLIPSLPGVDSHAIRYERFLGDVFFESYAQTSPGLYLTLLGAAGWWQGRRQVGLWAPVAGLLGLSLLYHPILLPTLKLFPWFAFNRHGGRATMIYPVLLCLLALPLRWPRHRVGQGALLAVLGLMLAEWYFGYTLRRTDNVPKLADRSLITYLQTVRDTPGKAVLDWPFCVQGADGTGTKEGLCPHYHQQNGVNTLRRFYHKAVVGQYVGRLHPDLVKPFLRDAWPRLLAPNYRFTAADWLFLDHFLRKNEFAGINLYPDLLPPDQVRALIMRYGPVTAQARHPMAGRLLFLPIQTATTPTSLSALRPGDQFQKQRTAERGPPE